MRGSDVCGSVRIGKGCAAGSATVSLHFPLAVGSESLAVLVFAFDAGHGVSPLAFCGETSQNTLGSEAWVTPRFGLAPTPAGNRSRGAYSAIQLLVAVCPLAASSLFDGLMCQHQAVRI